MDSPSPRLASRSYRPADSEGRKDLSESVELATGSGIQPWGRGSTTS